MKKFATALGVISALALAGQANAAIVTSLSGATTVVMPALESFTSGPIIFGPITYTSTDSGSVIGYTGGYGLASNGSVSGSPPIAGLNASVGSMTFTFSTLFSGILSDINWAVSGSSDDLPITASIFDSSSTLLETITFSTDGSSNAVAPGYWGFSRGAADIASLTLSNGYIIARDFSYTTAASGAVPEPATWAMMLLGFGLIGAAMRRRQKVAVRYAF